MKPDIMVSRCLFFAGLVVFMCVWCLQKCNLSSLVFRWYRIDLEMCGGFNANEMQQSTIQQQSLQIGTTIKHNKTTSWWFEPIWKICSSNWIQSSSRGENQKSFETSWSSCFFCRRVNSTCNSPPFVLQGASIAITTLRYMETKSLEIEQH